jgi:hypothetical protein
MSYLASCLYYCECTDPYHICFGDPV